MQTYFEGNDKLTRRAINLSVRAADVLLIRLSA